MSDNSNIEWTGSTLNAIAGCRKISPECDGCYAIADAWRMAHNPNEKMKAKFLPVVSNERGKPNWTGKVTFTEEPLFAAIRNKKPTTYFVNSLSDLFYEEVKDEWIDKHFATFALCPQHTFQILTKRPERMREYVGNTPRNGETASGNVKDCLYRWSRHFPAFVAPKDHYNKIANAQATFQWPLPNVWLGTSVGTQKYADERIPALLQTPAAVRFLSMEPLLGPIDLNRDIGGTRWIGGQRGCDGTHHGIGSQECPSESHHHHDDRCSKGIDWIITGGESGPKSRPMHPDWVRSIQDQCNAAGVPFFFKQWGAWWPIGQMPDGVSDSYYDPKHGKPKRPDYDDRPAPKPVQTTVLQLDGSQEFAFPSGSMTCLKVGKKKAGRLLDGRTWDEMPEAKSV